MSAETDSIQADARSVAELIYRRYREPVLAFLRVRFGGQHAEEIASRVWEKLAMGHLPDAGRDAWPWLRTVAFRTGIDVVRSELRSQPFDAEADAADPTDRVDAVHDRLVLRSALADLDQAERDAVALVAEGWSPAEIGERHGRTAHAMHCLASRTRGRLRRVLERALVPVFAVLCALRRWVRHAQPSVPATMALEAAVLAALVLAAPKVETFAPQGPGVEASIQAGSFAPADRPPAQKRFRTPMGTRLIARPRTADPGSAPNEPVITADRDAGAAAPRYMRIQQPRFDTPYGPVGGGRTEMECDAPRSFEVVPRNDEIYQLC